MKMSEKIEYYDLREVAGRLPRVIGRRDETARLDRVIDRRISNNAVIVGPAGVGKSTMVYGWMRAMASRARNKQLALLQISVEHLHTLNDNGGLEDRFQEALSHLPPCILFIDDFGHEVHQNSPLLQRIHRVYKQILRRPDVHVVLTLAPHEHAWLEREHSSFLNAFETIALKNQTSFECVRIARASVSTLNARHRIIIPEDILKDIVAYAERFPTLGQLPRSAIRLLDESISLSASTNRRILSHETVATVVEAKTGVPRARLSEDELQGVRALEQQLNERVIGQEAAIAKITRSLQRAKLGLRDPRRPLGSFLLLGPSGVGKTETAKCVAEIMFGTSERFMRFDMSEFQQDHTVQRLIGAPAGYIGYEEGGALTNALRKEPHSLILLDEIEKAHPKVFDIFLQVLDDGRLTSGQNDTVDARDAIIMATSNVAVAHILEAYTAGDIDDESFIAEKIMPILAQTFRLEFLNRFDSILIFKPLGVPSLIRIAQLEVKKIERRLAKHRVQFEIEPGVLKDQVQRISDPRFGARPVKRFIEETCETLLAQSLLTHSPSV
ncbi:MAG: AAA family ATPase [Patescibacteria group bacterium]